MRTPCKDENNDRGDASTSQEMPCGQQLKERDMADSAAEPLEEMNLAKSLTSDFQPPAV